MDFSAGIAINDDSGRVYAKYYDQDNDIAHLWALNKDTGGEIWDNPVPAVYSTMAAAGEPTIGPDGTIYVRFFKSLRAYNPDSNLEWEYNVNASQEWLEPFISIGPQGNIYICGSNFSSSPKYAWIRSLRTTDKQLLWEFQKQYPSDTSNYTFGAPIVAYDNNMIYAVFHELSSPGYRKLYALKENVGGLTEMWEHEGAEAILLGSTGAAYLLDRESEKIIALSGGEVGDPEGAGMAYTNNSAPSVPSSPTPSNGEPNQDYCEPLLLSWACSDPEGHPLKYDVYLGEGELGLYAQNDWNDTNCVVTGLRPGTGYLWRVVATDGQAVKEGPTWAFATKPAKTDLNNDGKVNFVDFAFIANRWMDECSEPNWCDGCDLDHSGATNMTDLSIFAGTWLMGISCNYRVINIRQLTDGVIGESGCAFNADGTKVAYRNFHPPYSWNYCDIWTIETDGSNNTQVTAAINGEFAPAFLPDGRITYSKEFGSNDYDIWMVDANGSNAHSFIGGAYRQCQSHWYAAGTKIVYANEYQWAGPSEIWTANADGSGQTQLTNHTVDEYGQFGPIYSRSSNLIAYGNYMTPSEQQHVWIMNADGSGKQQITGGTSSQSPCFWWPDDSRIGYTENGKVYLRDIANGTDQLLLEIPGATIDECDLSTDGTKLVFALSDGSEFHIWIGDVICEP
jgi:Tol biopolymer transport system component